MSYSTGGDVRASEYDFKEPNTEVWSDKDLLFSFRISSQPANAFIIPCPAAARRSLQSTSTITSMPISVSPSLSVNFSRHGPLTRLRLRFRFRLRLRLRLRLRFLSYFKGALLLNFNGTVECQLLVMTFGNSKTSSLPYLLICALSLISCVGAKDVTLGTDVVFFSFSSFSFFLSFFLSFFFFFFFFFFLLLLLLLQLLQKIIICAKGPTRCTFLIYFNILSSTCFE